jgi:general transcription factor IIIA
MKALTTHNNVIHLGHRNHVCPHQHCSSAFGYKKLLNRHLARIHSTRSDQSVTDPSQSDGTTTTDTDTDCPDNEPADSAAHLSIDRITGHAYSLRTCMPTSKTIRCPYPNVEDLLLLPPETPLSGSSAQCDYILTRAYDLRRHLKAEHGLVGDKSKVDSWVRLHRGNA